ncbi:MAG: bifunctional alpha/beta hydrolase/class I SAM-dependent methyltransferase [Hyphomicrobium sp.]|nr:bifunctional alpha/beta hydrolase/class I SAM-dependent methyltransferase [Hyphomicrobium sp.]
MITSAFNITFVSPRVATERTFKTREGAELFFRHWPAQSGKPAGAIVLFHRGHEHSGRMAHLVDELAMPEYAVYAWDARGHGRSPGERGDAPSFGTAVQDVDDFINTIVKTDGIKSEDIAIIAQSVGAVLVSTWVHDYAPKIRAMVLASPAFGVKLYVPFARQGLAIQKAVRGNFFVNSYVKARFLSHDAARIASYNSDPLITRAVSVRMLLGLYDAADRVVRDAQAITVPTQVLISGADWVVRHGPQHEFFVNLGSHTKERHVLDGFYHDTLGEKDRHLATGKITAFLKDVFARPCETIDLRDAHRAGYTRTEAERLATPLSIARPRGAYWALGRLGMKIGGLISDGIAVGHKTGFDSGSMLDYVYRNKASGKTALGRFVDRSYINAVGWKGIRQRKLNAEALINRAMEDLKEAGKPVRVLDIAAGHGRYVLEALTAGKVRPDSILLRDYSDINVAAGSRLISALGLSELARFEKGDAFNAESIAEIAPNPTVGIVSGLYELFPDNDMIARSLSGMARALPQNGYLVYTCQPWHPQLELIARTLTSHRAGQPWVMRRRSQSEMDQLVAAAGFEKIEQRIDEWGIFTVSLARKTKV